ncbi:glycosyltransferase [Actinomadura madurae]|uniref:glycosyltransferase n=1 Tax=Actinomadura madurae TaxID=1993 RepID=UPI0020D23E6C|nr:glycosyltransferase [Actinomadura madurae]MCP9972511.1 glycosyltransferase [Actinomadura madurae]
MGLNFPGVYNPLRSMVAEIARLGAGDVYFCSTDDRADDIESISDDDSVRFVSLGPAKPGHNPAEWDQERYEELHPPSRLGSFSAYVRNADFDYVRELYRRVDRVFDEVRPRLVLLESMCTFAMDAAMLRGIPFIISQPNPVSALMADRLPWSYPTPLSGLPLRMTLVQKVENVLFRIARGILMARPGLLRRAIPFFKERKAMGLPNPTMAPGRYVDAAAAVVGHSVFGLEYPFPKAPAHLRMYGAMIPPERDWGDGTLKRWLDEHESVVFIGFGTMMRQTREQMLAILEAVAALGPDHHVLWKLPPAQRERLPPGFVPPPNLRIEEWLPSQLSVLDHPHVKVFFNQAGGNATHEGLYFGKPMLVLPFWLDCYDFAIRMVDSGAALKIDDPHRLDGRDIERRLRRLLEEPGFAGRGAGVGPEAAGCRRGHRGRPPRTGRDRAGPARIGRYGDGGTEPWLGRP